jgi:hypothetical protein
LSEPLGPRRRHWIEYAATFAALTVSVISLWVAIATEQANQKMVDANDRMVAAASWPYLQLNSSNDDNGKKRITLELENAGVGPAKIQSLEVFWRGKAYGSAFQLLRDCCAPGQDLIQMGTVPVQGVVLRAGAERQFLSIDLRSDNLATWKAFDQVRLSELTYRACYCSVFDECWVRELRAGRALRVKACPKPATPYTR